MRVDLARLLPLATLAAVEASKLITSKWQGEFKIERKTGTQSLAAEVVTEVDRAAEAIIYHHLRPTVGPGKFGFLGEEGGCDGSRFTREAFWCVDPLDGTLPFIEGTAGFATSIALVARDGAPLLGVVADPVSSLVWSAARGLGAARQNNVSAVSNVGNVFSVFADRSFKDHPRFEEALMALNEIATELGLGAVDMHCEAGAVLNAIKTMQSGPACYFKFRRANGGGSLWDYAATACLFAECGLPATDMDGQPFDLNRAESTFMNHRGVVYASSQAIACAIRARLG